MKGGFDMEHIAQTWTCPGPVKAPEPTSEEPSESEERNHVGGVGSDDESPGEPNSIQCGESTNEVQTENNPDEQPGADSFLPDEDDLQLISDLAPLAGDFSSFLQLQSHLDSWPSSDVDDWRRSVRVLEKTLDACALEPPLVPVCPWTGDLDVPASEVDSGEGGDGNLVKARTFLTREDLLLHLVSAVESNAFGIWNAKQVCMGRAVYPWGSLFNHSCKPTCEPEQKGSILTFVSLRNLELGDPLTISYIPQHLPLAARREKLRADYYFQCQCERCTEEEQVSAAARSGTSRPVGGWQQSAGRGKRKVGRGRGKGKKNKAK
ncbi:hypothetical protein M427DRAFT_135584 [Gonapodya prolifera JEL478]|uniref:SET domain-containing protein n=1 Tax=Gonapodya prolifera (strain JEL478) TaxID=1344416 RepID=A0A139ACV9_GONPJ|nr:hypothetical protein M427DRAFT_135584 [Gonapodya prolifera JEL478]|eukprot:KXS14656.1 hypothetical protein M427DRAFT_135584 [Gonapodya prolifera JEL478]